jgi:hypothetical protein
MSGMTRALAAFFVAVACGPSALAAPPPEADRFMVVLERTADLAALDALEQRLRTGHQARIVSRATQGALLGLLVTVDVSRAPAIAREKSVASVVRVAKPQAPAPPDPSAPVHTFNRAPPGWAIPGLYGVVLRERVEWGFALELPPDQKALTGIARRDALRARRAVLIQEASEQVAAQYGGALRNAYLGDQPTFECAMTEDAALRMAADERVSRVSESIYILGDDPPPTSIREPSPGPTPWRP